MHDELFQGFLRKMPHGINLAKENIRLDAPPMIRVDFIDTLKLNTGSGAAWCAIRARIPRYGAFFCC